MTATVNRPAAAGNGEGTWEDAGARASALVRDVNIVLLAGLDGAATARAAIGLAMAEKTGRDVSVVDAWGQLRELETLVGTEDSHGASDYLEFGASWSRLRTPVPGTSSLSVIKSGSDEIAQESLLTAERWAPLFARYRDSRSLLVLVGKLDSPGLPHLAKRVDVVLLVGTRDAGALSNVKGVVRPMPAALPSEEAPVWSVVHRWPVLVVVAIVAAGIIALLIGLPPFGSGAPRSGPADAVSMTGSTVTAPLINYDSLPILNPGDSAVAAAYSVEIALLNTRAGANMRLSDLANIPGSTIVPLTSDSGDTWYRVVSGAMRTHAEADSLQGELRAVGIAVADVDRIVRLPLALKLAVFPPSAEAAAEVGLARYTSVGIPAYFLAQADGSLVIYAGAFERPGQASHMARNMAQLGIPARLEYRKGR